MLDGEKLLIGFFDIGMSNQKKGKDEDVINYNCQSKEKKLFS